MTERSIYQQFERVNQEYYGIIIDENEKNPDLDPSFLVPSAGDKESKEVAHELAIFTQEIIDEMIEDGTMTDEDFYSAVHEVEELHARLAPKDFGTEAQKRAAFLMATGLIGTQDPGYYIDDENYEL